MIETVRDQGDQIGVHAAKISALEEADRQHDERLRISGVFRRPSKFPHQHYSCG
jgi:hypothetical protein